MIGGAQQLITCRQQLRTAGQKASTIRLTFSTMGCLNPDGHEWSMATRTRPPARRTGDRGRI